MIQTGELSRITITKNTSVSRGFHCHISRAPRFCIPQVFIMRTANALIPRASCISLSRAWCAHFALIPSSYVRCTPTNGCVSTVSRVHALDCSLLDSRVMVFSLGFAFLGVLSHKSRCSWSRGLSRASRVNVAGTRIPVRLSPSLSFARCVARGQMFPQSQFATSTPGPCGDARVESCCSRYRIFYRVRDIDLWDQHHVSVSVLSPLPYFSASHGSRKDFLSCTRYRFMCLTSCRSVNALSLSLSLFRVGCLATEISSRVQHCLALLAPRPGVTCERSFSPDSSNCMVRDRIFLAAVVRGLDVVCKWRHSSFALYFAIVFSFFFLACWGSNCEVKTVFGCLLCLVFYLVPPSHDDVCRGIRGQEDCTSVSRTCGFRCHVRFRREQAGGDDRGNS